ncbi:aminotransferase class I/II-fold pyridoxal phosphate-dependent enzyme [Mesorhizobium japonicum]|uniref:aspartate transaminase n=1 Tax=Mesorhizobium japonicum (strain LMG 29417 / CECT 9101 / MAFF 303099) TaxID=266835 RepID=Q982E3_RHILO|nr:aminotransferase class I/II-fold pyridoxal phosphate-dependent enzyme [Mesorhizobium japonicum]BAB54516.1 aspartate aminotransferase [Mesorhizobium japonicum MAFF 303099]
MLSQRMSLLSGPGTVAAQEPAELAQLAAAAGRQIIDLAAGEIIIETPLSVREGAIAAINAGTNRYTDAIGLTLLRKAVAEKLAAQTHVGWNLEDIVITAGAKQALLNAALAVLDPGDEVIIIRPSWPTFASQILLAGAKPVFVDSRPSTYIPNIGAVRDALTQRTKAIIVNSPNNPTGIIYDPTTLRAIGDLAIDHHLWIVSDECYSCFVFAGRHESIVTAHPGVRSRTILVNTFSKELAITGWRLGYLAGPPEIVAAAKKLQSDMTSNANVIAQHAVLHHLEVGDCSFERKMHQRLSKARHTGLRILAGLEGVTVPRADGTFFFYLDLKRLISELSAEGPVRSADDIARLLLDETDVATVAGGFFGDMNGLRLSFGVPQDLLELGLKRVVETLNSLKTRQPSKGRVTKAHDPEK